MYTVGCVPYVNARPLVHWIEDLGPDAPVKIFYEVPSALPASLSSAEADAVMVSSVECLTQPGARIAEGVCIGTDGPVESVKLFSRVPFGQITTLALDQSSLTSNRLGQLVLREVYGAAPKVVTMPPVQETMLAQADACILIGDIGMSAPTEGLNVLDLGEAWTSLTGLPFVWAVWTGGERLTPELVALLNAARLLSYVGRNPNQGMQSLRRDRFEAYARSISAMPLLSGEQQRDAVVRRAAERSGWDVEDARRYLTETIIYDLGDRALQGLAEFGRRLVSHGLVESVTLPTVVPAEIPVVHG